MSELKDCPFCGGKAKKRQKYSDIFNCKMYYVRCMVCSAQTEFTRFEEVAELRWNERVKK